MAWTLKQNVQVQNKDGVREIKSEQRILTLPKQPRHQKCADRHQQHWRSFHNRTSSSTPPMRVPWYDFEGMYDYSDTGFGYSPWKFHEIPYFSLPLPKRYDIYDQSSWPFQQYCH